MGSNVCALMFLINHAVMIHLTNKLRFYLLTGAQWHVSVTSVVSQMIGSEPDDSGALYI